jgi:putative hydrolase of the HAD superfamily
MEFDRMALDVTRIRAVVFDYANTLIRFGEEQLTAYGHGLADALIQNYGPLDLERFFALRAKARREPYEGNPPLYREHDLALLTRELVRELYGEEPSQGILDALLDVRFRNFVNVVHAEEDVAHVLTTLTRRYTLGLLSNYTAGSAIRASLDKAGLAGYFDSVVVSGDLGYVKPHPILFAKSLEELGLPAYAVLFVGDNWLADVQGAKRVGMQMVQMRRWAPPEHFEAGPGDYEPDTTIGHLSEVPALLGLEAENVGTQACY